MMPQKVRELELRHMELTRQVSEKLGKKGMRRVKKVKEAGV